MKRKYATAATAISLLAFCVFIPSIAVSEKPLTEKDLGACIERAWFLEADEAGMAGELSELDAMREELRNMEDSARELRKKMEALKGEGKVEEYNALVAEHNALTEKHRESYARYDAVTAAYNARIEELAARRDSFNAECISKRYYKMDLRDACEATKFKGTEYCEKNKK